MYKNYSSKVLILLSLFYHYIEVDTERLKFDLCISLLYSRLHINNAAEFPRGDFFSGKENQARFLATKLLVDIVYSAGL